MDCPFVALPIVYILSDCFSELQIASKKCWWRGREFKLQSFRLRDLLFFNNRLGGGDKSSRVALYAGDLNPSSVELDGSFGRSQEGFSTQRHCVDSNPDLAPLERNMGNPRQLDKSGAALAAEAHSVFTATS